MGIGIGRGSGIKWVGAAGQGAGVRGSRAGKAMDRTKSTESRRETFLRTYMGYSDCP